jgi:hypothetical protein
MIKNPSDSKASKKQSSVSHPGMMGDGTEEQNLDERGNPGARIKKDDVDAAFGKNSGTHQGLRPTKNHRGGVGGQRESHDSKGETDLPEGFQIIDYNEQEEIVTIELHRHLLQHPQQREAILLKFVEILERGPNLKSGGTAEPSLATALGRGGRLKATAPFE